MPHPAQPCPDWPSAWASRTRTGMCATRPPCLARPRPTRPRRASPRPAPCVGVEGLNLDACQVARQSPALPCRTQPHQAPPRPSASGHAMTRHTWPCVGGRESNPTEDHPPNPLPCRAEPVLAQPVLASPTPTEPRRAIPRLAQEASSGLVLQLVDPLGQVGDQRLGSCMPPLRLLHRLVKAAEDEQLSLVQLPLVLVQLADATFPE